MSQYETSVALTDAKDSQKAKVLSWVERLKSHFIAKKLPTLRLHTLAELLVRLERVEESGDGWSARCPSHPDSRPSLSIGVALDGTILLNCHRDCKFEDIVQDAGMLMSEMFDTAPSTRTAILPPRRVRELKPDATLADPAWAEKHANLLLKATPATLQQLADRLGVSIDSLEALGVGWCNEQECWTFPERNGEQEICGIVRRYSCGGKYAYRGGHRGLTLPSGWDTSDQPLHICEGASDVAAAITHDMRAIGRPGLKAGFNDLAVLLKAEPAEIVMVADNDAEGIGREGAEALANRLSTALKRPIQVMAPPKQFKDLRECLGEVVK